jgi:hypothetical protein
MYIYNYPMGNENLAYLFSPYSFILTSLNGMHFNQLTIAAVLATVAVSQGKHPHFCLPPD